MKLNNLLTFKDFTGNLPKNVQKKTKRTDVGLDILKEGKNGMWDEQDLKGKGDKLVNTVEGTDLSIGDKVLVTEFKYGNQTISNVKGTIKQILSSHMDSHYHYNIFFDVPFGNDKGIKRDHWMLGPYGKKQPNNIKKQ